MRHNLPEHARKAKSKRHLLDSPLLLIFLIAIYVIVINVGAGKLDIYDATRFYYNWVDEIVKLDFSLSGIASTYNATLREISAPEPVPGIVVYLVTLFVKVPASVFHLLNVLVLILYAHFIKNTFKETVLFTLMFLVVTTGYYEYALLHMVHRFKISFFFLMLSLYFANRRQELSETLFVLSLLSHFSMIPVLPIIFCLRRLGFTVLPNFSGKKLVATLGVLAFVYIIYGLDGIDSDYLSLIFFNKFNQSTLPTQVLFFGAVLFLIYGLSRRLLNRLSGLGPLFWLLMLFIYVVSSLYFVGTSRLLMVYYITFLLIYLANYPNFSARQRIVIFSLFLPLFSYNFINGFIKGPVSIVYSEMF